MEKGMVHPGLLVCLICVLGCWVQLAASGCVESQLCCSAKNNTCRASGPRINSKNSRFCFCDANCIYMKDCCSDYEQYCRAVDCVPGRWGPWSACSSRCGEGFKERSRSIHRPAQNGGKDCKGMVEKQRCYSNSCPQNRGKNRLAENAGLALRETAKIIPAMYGTWRVNKKYNPYMDIRRNLFNHYKTNTIIDQAAYCATFEVTRAAHHCHTKSVEWTKNLRKGRTMCVECQPFSMKSHLGYRCRGHGVLLEETRWDASTVNGCHGSWVMKTAQRECSCNPKDSTSFILL